MVKTSQMRRTKKSQRMGNDGDDPHRGLRVGLHCGVVMVMVSIVVVVSRF
jgi:hypothetical protein